MAPSTKEDLQALTLEDLKVTEAHTSLATFLTENGPVEITPEHAAMFIYGHRIWQSSPERKAEKDALKETRNTASEEKKAEREEKKAQRLADARAKAEEREAKKAQKAAKDSDSDEDLVEADAETLEDTGEEAKPTKRRRRAPQNEAPAEEF